MRQTKDGTVFDSLQELKSFYINKGEIVDDTYDNYKEPRKDIKEK